MLFFLASLITCSSCKLIGSLQRGPGVMPSQIYEARIKDRATVLEFSRNMTIVLENLLGQYDNNQRPGYGGHPTLITTNIHVKSMGPISELDMEYTMDCYFRQTWNDERLKFEGDIESLTLNIKMLELIWKPDTYFHNGKDSYLHTITRPNKFLRIFKSGKIYYSMRLTIKAKCPMLLHSFPMDVQSCPLVFGSYAYTSEDLVYRWDPEGEVKLDNNPMLSQFDLINFPFRNTTVRFQRGVFSALQVNFNLRRHMGYFLIQVYIPCIMIVILSWFSFWLNREATADRVNLGITTVLTLSAFVLDTRTDLPKVSYPTALDWFVIMCFVFVMSTLLEFAGVHYFTKSGSGEFPIQQYYDKDSSESESDTAVLTPPPPPRNSIPITENLWTLDVNSPAKKIPEPSLENCRERSPLRFLAKIPSPLVLPTAMVKKRRAMCCVQFAKCFLGNDKYRAELKRAAKYGDVNSVSKIDVVSRICFPLSFFVLNLFYWFIFCRTPVYVSWDKS